MGDELKFETVRPIDAPAANQLLNTLRNVRSLEERWHEANVEPTHPESQLNRDLAVGSAAFGFNAASNAIATAIDHLHTWHSILGCDLKTFAMPIVSHYTLARAAYEPSLHALWLLDREASSQTRIARGYAMELQSHNDLRKYQEASGKAPGEITATKFIERLFDAARLEGLVRLNRNNEEILMVGPPNMVDLFNDYAGPEPPGRKAEWRWRMLSGLAHSRRWAVVANAAEVETATDDGYLMRPNWEYLQLFAKFSIGAAARALDSFITYRCQASTARTSRSGEPN